MTDPRFETSHGTADGDVRLSNERQTLLEHVHAILDGMMLWLSVAWIALVVTEFVGDGLPRSLEAAVWVIWAIFVLDFVAEFSIAPNKRRYLREQWLVVVSLLLPAFRILRMAAILRVVRAARVARSVGLLRVVTSINRGLASLRATAATRGVGYLLGATAIVIAVGAGGMAYFESPASLGAAGIDAAPIHDYGDALWWTAYAMTTGATSHPATAEGRLLGWLLSLYGLGVFGYLTATLASHFIIRRERPDIEGASTASSSTSADGDDTPTR